MKPIEEYTNEELLIYYTDERTGFADILYAELLRRLEAGAQAIALLRVTELYLRSPHYYGDLCNCEFDGQDFDKPTDPDPECPWLRIQSFLKRCEEGK